MHVKIRYHELLNLVFLLSQLMFFHEFDLLQKTCIISKLLK